MIDGKNEGGALPYSEGLIEPLYATGRANSPIFLGRAPFYITWEGNQFTCPGEAYLRLQPRLRLTLTADLSHQPTTTLRLATASVPIKLQYGQHAEPINALLVNVTSHSGPDGFMGRATFIPNPERLTVCNDRRKRLAAVTFHVMNFPAFLSQGEGAADLIYETLAGQSKRLGRVFLEHAGWLIELQTLPEAVDLIKELEAEGGFAITHVGRLTRKNGSTFWASQAEAILHDLHRFLSFARGLWVPLVLPVGLDAAGNRVFEEWGSRLATAWEPRTSWFDDHNGQVLGALYPGFIDLLQDPDLGEPVRAALYWYLRSNRAGEGAGVDSGVILSQAALERLTGALLSKSGLQAEGNATDCFRRAFGQLKLPTAIPMRMAALMTGRRKGMWSDLPEVIVRVRNELTHPKARLPMKVGKVIGTVWQIAQWYIELCILALAGYEGVYSNRLSARWRGEVERIPWGR